MKLKCHAEQFHGRAFLLPVSIDCAATSLEKLLLIDKDRAKFRNMRLPLLAAKSILHCIAEYIHVCVCVCVYVDINN